MIHVEVKTKASQRLRLTMVPQVNLNLPCGKTGEPQRVDGAKVTTRHLNRLARVLVHKHGKLPEGCKGEWKVGKGDPNETPMP